MIEQRWFNATDVGKVLGIQRRTVLAWVQQGRLPQPQKFGKSARWSAATIESIEREGVPSLKETSTDQVEGMHVSCPECGAKFRVLTHRPDTTSTRKKPTHKPKKKPQVRAKPHKRTSAR